MADRERILGLADDGLTAPQISEKTGIHLRTVQRVLASEGRSTPVGRPATGERDRVSFRVDEDVLEVLDAHAAERGTTRSDVAATVVAAWAQRSRNAKRTVR